MKLIKTWKELNSFQAKHVFLRHWADLPMLAFAVIGIAYLAISALSRYEAALIKRIDADDKTLTWQVSVNGVAVGIIADAVYAAIRRHVIFDVHIYVAQLFNFGNVLFRVIDSLFVAIPLGVFWCGLACYFFEPDTFASILAELQKVTPAQIVSSAPTILQMMVVVSIMLITAAAVTGRSFGFVNQFDQAICKGIRRAISCAAEGDIFLYHLVDDKMVVPKELDFIRSQMDKTQA